ncbi:PTB domain-containing adapter protein ced-6-like isoform X2 [Oppia nitens]|nr:PTB domain-containing adapter protein ced-6-like isoform X2 [Oppia nitens]XP_054161463.1 PTB domain-containing adapter protein ced-6-like isoform X2 [Oppia nitens]XP_054161464.1 PTB domain-containing adapter protein ced-6-like isoform X2 [Oppia nitens]
MIKQSSLLKWTQNGNKNMKSLHKNNWIHPSEALTRGHVAYLVKFLGNTDVDQPKGIEIVKEGIRKLKFNQHIKRAEGSKIPKVELTISIDGVAVQEPKSKRIYHQFPLHRISYCADDKSEKKFFSFIAKESETEKHNCFVFISDKLAEEITLTIGQAFDLAYRRFLETSGRDMEMRKQLMILQKRVRELEQQNQDLKTRLCKYEQNGTNNGINNGINNGTNSEHNSQQNKQIKTNFSADTTHAVNGNVNHKSNCHTPPQVLPPLQPPPSALPRTLNRSFSENQSVNLLDLDMSHTKPTVGRKLENLNIIDKDTEDEDFNPRANDLNNGCNGSTLESVPNGHSLNKSAKDIFGSEPFNSGNDAKDPFGMGEFAAHELETAIGAIDRKLAEMRDGFSRGLSFGNDEFTIESMDPLNHKT